MNEIRGLFKEISKFRIDLGQNYKQLKSKDQNKKVGVPGSLIDFIISKELKVEELIKVQIN